MRPLACLAAALALALAGCGYKGPLTLPPPDQAQKPPAGSR